MSRQPFGLAALLADLPQDHRDARDPRRRARGGEVRASSSAPRRTSPPAIRSTPSTASGSRSPTAGACSAPRTPSRSSSCGSRPPTRRRWTPPAARSSAGSRGRASGPSAVSRRARRLAALLAGLVALLFAGRWTAVLLADRWWAAELSPAAVALPHRLAPPPRRSSSWPASWSRRPGSSATCWSSTARSGSVQVRRNVANLEFREALTPASLLALAVAGRGDPRASSSGSGRVAHAPQVALGWQGVSYGALDPLLQRDLGLYVAQLPLWRALHDFCFLLVMARRSVWSSGCTCWSAPSAGSTAAPPSTTTRAPTSAGCSSALALTLMWGYLLEPFELVAGLRRHPRPGALAGDDARGAAARRAWRSRRRCSRRSGRCAAATRWPRRAGSCCRSRRWSGHWMVPPAVGGEGEPLVERRTLDQFERQAYGLEALTGEPRPRPPQRRRRRSVPALWNRPMAARLLAADSVDVVSVDPALLTVGGRPRPVWLATRALPGGHVVVAALADDRTGAARRGAVLSPAGLASPSAARACRSGPRARRVPWPAPGYRHRPGRGRGRGARLVAAADCCSRGRCRRRTLLGPLAPDARVDWALSPTGRLARLAPFAAVGRARGARRSTASWSGWSMAMSRPQAFPLATADRVARAPASAGLRAACSARSRPQTGATRIYLRPGSDALASAWAAVAGGVVEPSPRDARRRLARGAVSGGSVPGAGAAASSSRPRTIGSARRPDRAPTWPSCRARMRPGPHDTSGPAARSSPFERPGERRLSALLLGSHDEDERRASGWCASIPPARCRRAARSRAAGRASRPTTR